MSLIYKVVLEMLLDINRLDPLYTRGADVHPYDMCIAYRWRHGNQLKINIQFSTQTVKREYPEPSKPELAVFFFF